MPKKPPPNSDAGRDLEALAQMGRLVVAAGIQHLKPRLSEWLDLQLESMLNHMVPAELLKPARGARALARVEESLATLVSNDTAGDSAPPKRGRPAGSNNGHDNYWSRMNPEERKAEMTRRFGMRGAVPAKPKGLRVWPTTEMIEGRYTKAGAAKVLGVSIKSLGYVLARAGKPIPMIRTSGKGRTGTYNPVDIDALAASRKSHS